MARGWQRAQGTLEYALLSGLIAGGLILGVAIYQEALQSLVTGSGSCVDMNDTTSCSPGFGGGGGGGPGPLATPCAAQPPSGRGTC